MKLLVKIITHKLSWQRTPHSQTGTHMDRRKEKKKRVGRCV